MCSSFSTELWRALEDNRVVGAIDMYGQTPLLHHNNSLIQPPSWPLGEQTSNFHHKLVECCWVCLIGAIFCHIQFQLELKVTRIWKICVGRNCVIFSTVTLRGYLVGVQGVKNVARMASPPNSTPTCAKWSFRDVVVGSIGTTAHGECWLPSGSLDIPAVLEGVPKQSPRNVLPKSNQVTLGGMLNTVNECHVEGQHTGHCDGGWQIISPRRSLRSFPQVVSMTNGGSNGGVHVLRSLPHVVEDHSIVPGPNSGRNDKENVEPESVSVEVQPLKPKRKYVRKHLPTGGEQAGIDKGADNLMEMREPTITKAKRPYTRKKKVVVPMPMIVQRHEVEGERGRVRRGGRGHGGSRTSGMHEAMGRQESPELLPPDSREFSPPTTRAHFNQSSRVRVLLRDLIWGGEVLPVPCPYAIGTILGREDGADGNARLRCDFGAHLGIQAIPESACEVVLPHVVPSWETMLPTSLNDAKNCEQNGGEYDAPSRWELADTDSEYDWDPALSDLGSESHHGFSSGASSMDVHEDDPMSLLGELGIYSLGPDLENIELDRKYIDSNWHARTWSLLPRQEFKGKPLGPSHHLPADILLQPVDYFLLFWDETLQRKVVRESNSYANYVDSTTGKRKGGELTLKPITLEEFREFRGICCLMGVRDQPSIQDYWRRGAGALYCEDVACTMTRWRFEYILRCLHMTSKSDFVIDKQSPHYDPIGKCRWILEHVQAKFQQFWNLSPYITVDECMVAYNGRICSFKQYLPAKPITHGIKIWAMACSVTSYVYRLEIYVGKDNAQPTGPDVVHIGMAGKVVSRLTEGLEGQWYTVTCDNFFTSPYLFDDLLGRGFYAVGTARKQRKGFPTSMNISHEQPQGTLHIRVHKDYHMATIHWQDTKGVYFLATTTDPVVLGGVTVNRISGQRITEVPSSPIQVLYSQKMGGVDVGDQNRSYYSTQTATKKWWHRVYFFCQDSSIANSFTIHKEMSKKLGLKPLTHKEFQMRLAYSLMGRPYRDGGAQQPVQGSRRIPPQPCSSFVCHVPRKTNLCRVCRIYKR